MPYRLIAEELPEPRPTPFAKRTPKYLILLLPVFLFLISYPLSLYFSLRCASSQFLRGNFSTSQTCASFSLALSRPLPTISPYVVVYRQLAQSLFLANQFASSALPYLQSFLGRGPASSADITNVTFSLSRLSDSLAFLQASLQPLPRLAPLLTRVNTARTLAQKISPLVNSLPDLLSLHGKSTILLLLQDPTELRPTGGFLSHIALLTLDSGRLTNVQIYDTAATDSQLRGQISPPSDLARVIGESNWYLRDANWDPDFPSSADRALWFVTKELSLTPDRVVGVHLATLAELLSITGSIRLSELNLTLTRANFLSQYLAHPDFLSAFYQRFFDELRELNTSQLSQAAGQIISALESRQIFISSTIWSGGVAPPNCRSPLPCLSHYFYPVASNVGVNKANVSTQATAQLSVQLNPARADFAYQLDLSNTSSQTNWPAGHYKNYLRLYLPPQSLPDAVLLNGQPASAYYVTAEHGLVVLGVLVDVAPVSTVKVNVRWHQPLVLSSRFHYQLDIPNQPGQSSYPVTVTLIYPKTWFASTATTPTLASQGTLQYNQTLSRQLRFDIDFATNVN